MLRDLTRSLRDAAGMTGGVDVAQRTLTEARRFERDGDLVEAANRLRLAIALAPEREDVEREYERVRGRLAVSLADDYAKQAAYEESREQWSAAALSWAMVADGRPDDPEPPRRAAVCLLKAKSDLHQARAYAEEAVVLAPSSAEARVVLARVFLEAGMRLNARRELAVASTLDPSNQEVANLILECEE